MREIDATAVERHDRRWNGLRNGSETAQRGCDEQRPHPTALHRAINASTSVANRAGWSYMMKCLASGIAINVLCGMGA